MQMSELLNLLFTYVKLDSDGFQLNREEADLCELVRKAAAEQYDDLEAHDMELFLDLPEEPVTLSVDVLQVGRVLANLIGNVIRHNPDGTALFLELRRQGGMACLLVGDSGVEIPPELAERISQADLCLAGHFNKENGKANRTIPGKAYIYEAMKKPMILGDNAATRERYTDGMPGITFVEMGSPEALRDGILQCMKESGYTE